MKPRKVSVSLIEESGRIKVWNCSFELDGKMPLPTKPFDTEHQKKYEEARKKIEEAIAKAIAETNIEL